MWKRGSSGGSGGGGGMTYTEGTISGSSTTITCKKGDIIIMNFTRSSQVAIMWNGSQWSTSAPGFIYNAGYATVNSILEVVAQQETNTIALNGGTFTAGHYLIVSQ